MSAPIDAGTNAQERARERTMSVLHYSNVFIISSLVYTMLSVAPHRHGQPACTGTYITTSLLCFSSKPIPPALGNDLTYKRS